MNLERNDIIRGIARALFLDAYMSGADEGLIHEDCPVAKAQQDWNDVAPEKIPEAAWNAAFWVAGKQGYSMEVLLAASERADGVVDGLYLNDPEECFTFGWYVAQAALGAGVSWEDDHEPMPEGFEINSSYISGEHIDPILRDAGLLKDTTTCEVYKIADVNTAYVTAKDGELMQPCNDEGMGIPLHIASIPEQSNSYCAGDPGPGEIFKTPGSGADLRDDLDALKKFGFSESFCNIIEHLHKQGIDYVRFDRDGGEFTGDMFPRHEW